MKLKKRLPANHLSFLFPWMHDRYDRKASYLQFKYETKVISFSEYVIQLQQSGMLQSFHHLYLILHVEPVLWSVHFYEFCGKISASLSFSALFHLSKFTPAKEIFLLVEQNFHLKFLTSVITFDLDYFYDNWQYIYTYI